MGKSHCYEKLGLKKGSWTPNEDKILIEYIQKNGHGSWRDVSKQAGLLRCGKSCRLRWTNYLRPGIKRGRFAQEEERTIIQLHAILGNRWSTIASQLPGRTDNEVKNFWNTHVKKKLLRMGLDPSINASKSETNTAIRSQGSQSSALTRHMSQWENARLEAEARLSRESTLSSSSSMFLENDQAPTDYFLKLWNSEAGNVFRNEAITKTLRINCKNLHGVDLDQEHAFSYTDTSLQVTSTRISSLCSGCSSDHVNINQPDGLNGNQDNSADGIRKAKSHYSSSGDMTRIQTETNKSTHEGFSCCDELAHGHGNHNHDIQSLADPILDFPYNSTVHNSINPNNTISMMTELSTSFQQQSAWPWQELRLDEDKDDWNNVLN